MNTLLATEAKVSRALFGCRRRSVLAQAQEGGGQEVSYLLMRVTGRVSGKARFVMSHGRRSGNERCSCYEPRVLEVTGVRGNVRQPLGSVNRTNFTQSRQTARAP